MINGPQKRAQGVGGAQQTLMGPEFVSKVTMVLPCRVPTAAAILASFAHLPFAIMMEVCVQVVWAKVPALTRASIALCGAVVKVEMQKLLNVLWVAHATAMHMRAKLLPNPSLAFPNAMKLPHMVRVQTLRADCLMTSPRGVRVPEFSHVHGIILTPVARIITKRWVEVLLLMCMCTVIAHVPLRTLLNNVGRDQQVSSVLRLVFSLRA